MSRYRIGSVNDLRNLDNLPAGTRTNIGVGLQTPAGYTIVNFDPYGHDIKNMTIAQIEALAIEIFEKRMNG